MQKHWKPFPQIKKHKTKLKIGYVSPDFKNHSMESFLKPVLENHNREEFEIYAFAQLSQEDDTTLEYKSLVDQWVPTQGFTDWEMVQKIRELQIDILVDVAGHTKGNRLGVFAYKPTPIVFIMDWVWIYYRFSFSKIDYFLTDNVMAPEGSEHLFSLKICPLPDIDYCCLRKSKKWVKVGPLHMFYKRLYNFWNLN